MQDKATRLQQKYNRALTALTNRALGEPYNWYKVDHLISPQILASGVEDATILLECQKQFRETGSYSPYSIGLNISGVHSKTDSFSERAMQDAELDLPAAFDLFFELHRQVVETEIAAAVPYYIESGKSADEALIEAEKYRQQKGATARVIGTDGKEEFESELIAALDGKVYEYPVKPHLPKLRSFLPHYEPGDYIVVSALSGVGKSYFALNTIFHNAQNGVPCVYINLENSPKNMQKRLWQMQAARMFRRDMRGGDTETNAALAAWEQVKKLPIKSVNPGPELPAVLSAIRYAWHEMGAQFAAIDYAQLMYIPGVRDSRNNELGKVSAAFRSLALELQMPIMVLVQQKQEVDKTATKRGGLYDIKDCANFAQDATLCASLYRPVQLQVRCDPDGNEYAANYADITFVKGREQGLAFAACAFDPALGFYEAQPEFNPIPGQSAASQSLKSMFPASGPSRQEPEDMPF